jgi:hypothetical protein
MLTASTTDTHRDDSYGEHDRHRHPKLQQTQQQDSEDDEEEEASSPGSSRCLRTDEKKRVLVKVPKVPSARNTGAPPYAYIKC